MLTMISIADDVELTLEAGNIEYGQFVELQTLAGDYYEQLEPWSKLAVDYLSCSKMLFNAEIGVLT